MPSSALRTEKTSPKAQTQTKAKKKKGPALKTLVPNSIEALASVGADAADVKLETYNYANLRPGKLLLMDFSRPGSGKVKRKGEDAEGSDSRALDAKFDKYLEKYATKLVNISYQQMVMNFPHTAWGFFCGTAADVARAYEVIKTPRQAANYLNDLARRRGNERRVILDVYPIDWNHNDPLFRWRVSQDIASRLIDLRKSYTSRITWAWRVALNRVKLLPMLLLPGKQAEAIERAAKASKAQRPTMLALYGSRPPAEFINPFTGDIRDDIALDYTAIDEAIRTFWPDWKPKH